MLDGHAAERRYAEAMDQLLEISRRDRAVSTTTLAASPYWTCSGSSTMHG